MKHTVTWFVAGTVYEEATTVLDVSVLVTSIVLADITVDTNGLDVSTPITRT